MSIWDPSTFERSMPWGSPAVENSERCCDMPIIALPVVWLKKDDIARRCSRGTACLNASMTASPVLVPWLGSCPLMKKLAREASLRND